MIETSHTEPESISLSQSPPSPALVCSHCGSDNVRESASRRGADLIPTNLGKTPYRCRACRGRFYLRQPRATTESQAPRRKRSKRSQEAFWLRPSVRRHMGDLTVVAGAMVVFFVFLYFLVRTGADY